MATARAMIERRRSSRIPVRIPIRLVHGRPGEAQETAAEAVQVSRCGALFRASIAPPLGSHLEVLHGLSQERREFRVVRVRGAGKGVFELGVEIHYPARNFWGVRFPGE